MPTLRSSAPGDKSVDSQQACNFMIIEQSKFVLGVLSYTVAYLDSNSISQSDIQDNSAVDTSYFKQLIEAQDKMLREAKGVIRR